MRKTVGRVRRRMRRLSGRQRATLPAGQRLDERIDLREFDIGQFSWGHLTVSSRGSDARLRVGKFCSFAYGCHVILGGEHRIDFVSTYRLSHYPPFRDPTYDSLHTSTSKGAVTIGNDVWIGHESLILSGVEIGDGAVVGAGSVVRHNVPAYALVAGNPARVAGFRFPKEQIEALLRIRWWDWSSERIRAAVPMLMSDDIQAFIDTHDPGPPTN